MVGEPGAVVLDGYRFFREGPAHWSWAADRGLLDVVVERRQAMRITRMLSRSRRDFQAVYQCEGCGFEEKSYGYDDRNFHDNVIPARKCKKCGKSRNDLGIRAGRWQTKYPEWRQI